MCACVKRDRGRGSRRSERRRERERRVVDGQRRPTSPTSCRRPTRAIRNPVPRRPAADRSLLALGLLGRLGHLAGAALVRLGHRLDDADGDGLAHVAHGEAAERRVVGEGLDAHGLGRHHLDDGSITGLDELRCVFDGFTGTTIDLLQELREFAGNVGGVAVKHWRVTSTNLTGVVEDNDLSVEGVGAPGRVVLRVTGNVPTTDLLYGDVLDVEADVVTWQTLGQLLVVHLNGLDFGGDVGGSESHDHAGLDDTGLNTTHGHRPNARNLVHILEWETEWLVGRTGWGVDSINGLEEGLAGSLGLGLLLPALVPWAVGGVVDHVITVEAGDRYKRNGLGVVANFLDEVGSLFDDFIVTILRPFCGVHFVDSNDELLDAQGVREEGVLAGLSILGDTSLEFTSAGSDNKNGTISLGGTSDHVLDEVTMTRSIWN